jgi:hypothetical protein
MCARGKACTVGCAVLRKEGVTEAEQHCCQSCLQDEQTKQHSCLQVTLKHYTNTLKEHAASVNISHLDDLLHI